MKSEAESRVMIRRLNISPPFPLCIYAELLTASRPEIVSSGEKAKQNKLKILTGKKLRNV